MFLNFTATPCFLSHKAGWLAFGLASQKQTVCSSVQVVQGACDTSVVALSRPQFPVAVV